MTASARKICFVLGASHQLFLPGHGTLCRNKYTLLINQNNSFVKTQFVSCATDCLTLWLINFVHHHHHSCTLYNKTISTNITIFSGGERSLQFVSRLSQVM